jgi:hypothetical protein
MEVVHMKFTVKDQDYITVDEEIVKDESLLSRKKIHLIKLALKNPSPEMIDSIVTLFPNTNRFVIPSSANIRMYNDYFKVAGRKFYIENVRGTKLVSFFKKNNKVLLNICNLAPHEKIFVLNKEVLPDILWNCEVVQMKKSDYEPITDYFNVWNGNLILT